MPIENQSINPYGVVGLGAVIWNADDTTTNLGGKLTTDINTAFATKVGGGFDWFINNNWIINFEAAYVFNRPDVNQTFTLGTASASISDNVKLDYWTIGGGVKYLFS